MGQPFRVNHARVITIDWMYRFCSLTQELASLQVYQGIAENVFTGGCNASIFTIHITQKTLRQAAFPQNCTQRCYINEVTAIWQLI